MTNIALSPAPTVAPAAEMSPRREVWLSLRANRGAMVALSIIVTVVLTALFADVISPHNPSLTDKEHLLVPPAWEDGGMMTFPLGTDDIGRDLLSRIIHGTRLSLLIGLIVVTLSLAIGVSLGLAGGYFRGWIDIAIMRLMDVTLALPNIFLAIVIVVILGAGLTNAMIAVAISNVPYYARVTRAAVMNELTKDYVTASRVSGAGTWRLIFSTVLPNCMAPLIVQSTLGISSAMLDAAALGFLGLGAQPPTPEWGTMMADSRQYFLSDPWLMAFPGIAILLTVLAFNLLGDGLRDALDPKLKR
jgi:dipeptide transport system permease protein